MSEISNDGLVQHCLRCETLTPKKREEDDVFCQQCAAPLINRCTNEYGDSYGANEQCGVVLSPDAVYCPKCATISLFASQRLIENKYPEVEVESPRLAREFPF